VDLDYAMLADGVTPRPDGKLDIYGAGWDTIWTADVPTVHARLVLALRLLISRTEAEHPHKLDVIIQTADGTEIGRAGGSLDAMPAEGRQQIPAGRKAGLAMVMNFENLVFPAFGDYQIVIQWDGNEPRPPLRLVVARRSEPSP
jgi:hypothetical protein